MARATSKSKRVYRKSLLYLVSRAFEEQIETPQALLGTQSYSKGLEKLRPKSLFFHYSNGRRSANVPTASTTHGGFDNDPAMMNSVLKTVLGNSAVKRPFTAESFEY